MPRRRISGLVLCLVAAGPCFGLWDDLFGFPGKWLDYRQGKTNPRFPDFKRPQDGKALWLGSAPDWVVPKLEALGEESPWEQARQGKPQDSGDTKSLWDDLFDNPESWEDFRDDKTNPSYPDFKRREPDAALWINGWSTPTSVKARLEKESPWAKTGAKAKQGKYLNSGDTKAELWKDLLQSPEKWKDFRDGKINPNFPDFKRREDDQPLWLDCDSTPEWIPEELNKLGPKLWAAKQEKPHDSHDSRDTKSSDLWGDLFDSPDEWEDYRLGKTNPRFPDFKRMAGGKALWLGSAPEWVPEKLKDFGEASPWAQAKQRKPRDSGDTKSLLWDDLFDNPESWEDFRDDKTNPSFPDFKRRDPPAALWINGWSTPEWVKDKLNKLGAKTIWAKDRQAPPKPAGSRNLWHDLFESPDQWTDCRKMKQSSKVSDRHPDFKRYDGTASLWIDSSSTPDWVPEKLQSSEDLWPTARPSRHSRSQSSDGNPRRPKDPEEIDRRWTSLFQMPENWKDYRHLKKNGEYHDTHADFLRFEDDEATDEGLWCDETMPESARQELQSRDASGNA